MKNIKTSIIGKYALSLIAIATLSCSSLSFGMNIWEAIEIEDISIAKEILTDKCFNVNEANECGYTPLHWACFKDNSVIVDLLISRNADVNIVSHDGLTALILACSNGNLEIAKSLLTSGADINQEKLYSATNELEIKQLIQLVQNYDAAVNKNEFLDKIKALDTYYNKIKTSIYCDIYCILLLRDHSRYLNEVQKNEAKLKSNSFGKLYDQSKFQITEDNMEDENEIHTLKEEFNIPLKRKRDEEDKPNFKENINKKRKLYLSQYN